MLPPGVSSPPALAPERRLLLLAASFALGYHALLVVLDQWVFSPPLLPVGYYAVNSGSALVVLVLAAWPGAPARWGRAFLPLIIAVLALVPILSSYLLVSPALRAARALGLALDAEGLVLRLLPVLLLALILTAWYYPWPHVVLYCLGTSAVRVSALLLFAPGTALAGSLLQPAGRLFLLAVIGVETMGFLIIGYSVSAPVRRLRAQQAALDAANRRLRQHTGTLESLTISRERNRVARELHDTLAHTLSGLSVQLKAVDAYWEVDPGAARAVLHEAQETARRGLQETRQALTTLRANPLEDLGLALALRRLAEAAAARAHLQLVLTLPDHLPALPPDLEQGLYRVGQEAIANVIYHARARCLAVALVYEPGEIRLVIRDDGIGFDPALPVSPGHFGLAGIRERASLIGGQLTVLSRPGDGTTVDLCIDEGVTTQ